MISDLALAKTRGPQPVLLTSEWFWARVCKDDGDGCWLWPGQFARYGRIKVNGEHVLAHRVAWRFANGPIPPGLRVLHHCDNPPCVRPDHLFLGTDGDNVRDAMRKGRLATGPRHGTKTHPESRPRGTRHGNAKLCEADIREIRSRFVPGKPGLNSTANAPLLAQEFGISEGLVRKIVCYRAWSWLDAAAFDDLLLRNGGGRDA